MNHHAPLLAALLSFGSLASLAETLYFTDFEDFPVGDNAWAGFDGWLSNDPSSGAQGIFIDPVVGQALGKTAALGFTRPANAFTTVFRPINHDPAAGGHPLLEIQIYFGIDDSTEATNFRRDDFFFSFYNMEGDLLAAIRASNHDDDFGFWWQNGSLQAGAAESDTGVDFFHEELHLLNVRIDLLGNRWSAALDGIPLFQDQQFNGTGLTRNLGPLAIEWLIAAGAPAGFGDNWILVDEVRVDTLELEPAPLAINSLVRESDGRLTLSWNAKPGFHYSLEYSHDLRAWHSDLPDSSLPSPLYGRALSFTDNSANSLLKRFYRLRRTPVTELP